MHGALKKHRIMLNRISYRKVQTESATGSSNSYRVRTVLTICVENIDFDTQACVLRLKGRNVEENKYVKVISFKIIKAVKNVYAILFRQGHITRWTWSRIESLQSLKLNGIRFLWKGLILRALLHR